MEKKVSLKDIAHHLGVSVALVSYVLNGKEKQARVGAEMAEKVRRAARELNYRPNLVARSLQSGKTRTIGLIVADISNPFFSSIARIIEDQAKKLGYVVIFGSSDENDEKQQDLIEVFLNRKVDAFIISPAVNTEKQIISLQKMGIPVVLIDRYFKEQWVDVVHSNNHAAAEQAVSQLVRNGRKKIAMVAYDSPLQHMEERRAGYKAALEAGNLGFRPEWLVPVAYTRMDRDVREGLGKLLEPLQIDAVFFATNSLATAGLRRINEAGLKIPQDLALISFDENEAFDFFYAPVTYISQSLDTIGKEAVEVVVDRINGSRKAPVNKIVEAKLVVRESCGSRK